MENCILTSIKKVLGIEEEYEHFDQDIIMYINSAFMRLNQLGVGPEEGFKIVKNKKSSTNTLTISTQPEINDTITIGEKTFTFVAIPEEGDINSNGDISIGSTLEETQTNIVAAINGTDGVNASHSLVQALNFEANVSIIIALIGGSSGNKIRTTDTFTSSANIFSSTTLINGMNCSVANAEEQEEAVWGNFIGDRIDLEGVKTYVYLKTRLIFDPPQVSYLMEAIKEQIKELEWTLTHQIEGR
jgi:hypothetical protein